MKCLPRSQSSGRGADPDRDLGDARARGVAPSFAERVEFLKRAVAPAAGSTCAEVEETHLSWVVLGAERVLKMKKPGGHPVIDLSSPAVRRRNAHEEVRLNRRLAPEVYLGVLALEWRRGCLVLVPDDAQAAVGEDAIDWLVHMRRLPAERMLDALVQRQQFRPDQVDALVAQLAQFHRTARRVLLDGGAYVRRILDEQQANRRVLEDPRVGLAQAAAASRRFERAVARHSGALERRAQDGRLVEGHGDLRPEHVCMLTPPVVIDCLEFDATLRELDPFDEIAFLALEIGLLGATWLADALRARYAERASDPAGCGLWPLYTARRALLRARLVAAHLLDPVVADPASWRARAQTYARLADEATDASMRSFDDVQPAP